MALGREGLAASSRAVQWGASASCGEHRVQSQHGEPSTGTHWPRIPPCLSFSTSRSGDQQCPGLCKCERKCCRLQGRIRGVGGGFCVSVCSREGCACGMGRVRAQFSLAGAERLVLSWPVPSQWAGGDGDCAGRWRWSHSPNNTIPKALQLTGTPPRGLQRHEDTSAHLCQSCDSCTWALHIPWASSCQAQDLAGAWQHRAACAGVCDAGSRAAPPALGSGRNCLPSPWQCREGEDLQAVRAGARGQQGSESPFQRGHCPLLSI